MAARKRGPRRRTLRRSGLTRPGRPFLSFSLGACFLLNAIVPARPGAHQMAPSSSLNDNVSLFTPAGRASRDVDGGGGVGSSVSAGARDLSRGARKSQVPELLAEERSAAGSCWRREWSRSGDGAAVQRVLVYS